MRLTDIGAAICIATAGLVLAPVTKADVWAEREVLASIASEIESLEVLINDASKLASPDERLQFNYRALFHDLDLIKRGIADHLNQPMNPILPRKTTLQGAYSGANQ